MYRYDLGFKVPPGLAMITGSAVDSGSNHNMEQKIKSHEDLPVDDVLDAFATSFEARKHEAELKRGEEPGEFKDRGARALKAFQEELAPTIQPAAVQDKALLTIPNFGFDLMVVPDIIQEGPEGPEDKEVVRDMKFSGKSPDGVKSGNIILRPAHYLQIVCYALARSNMTEKPIVQGFIDYCVGTKTTAKAIAAPISFSERDFKYVQSMIGLAARQIELKVFPPNRQNQMCSRKFCGYWEMCIRDYGGTVRE
jgi:hypothetical protein